mmetsp:Transcript_303/g.487  ORF Transcript_303/g.487 Transcript_303/m.487 type:complete len:114 (+) Transcript_303:98-439(+)
MSWFRRSKPETQEESPFASDTSGFDSSGDFAEPSMPSTSSMNSSQLQETLQMEQQKAIIQTVVAKLTEIAFDKCVDRPSSSLSSREGSCIESTVLKYLDASEFVVGRVVKGQK